MCPFLHKLFLASHQVLSLQTNYAGSQVIPIHPQLVDISHERCRDARRISAHLDVVQ